MTTRNNCEGTHVDDKRQDCEREFERLWTRLSTGDIRFQTLSDSDHQHDIQIKELQVNMINLCKSMGSLTKAIWGMVSTILFILIGFFVWYVQSGQH